MSTTVLSKGVIFELLSELTDDQRENLNELEGVTINDDGRLLIYDMQRLKPYHEREFQGYYCDLEEEPITDVGEIQQQLIAVIPDELYSTLSVNWECWVPFTCIWYNGGDAPMWYYNHEQFSKRWQTTHKDGW